MDLSIIVPVYNTAQNDLIRCFDSLCRFDGITYEVVVVDDGSEEETADFCRAYAEGHPPFRYIRQENRGVSAARNKGLRQATGNYILFADADDELAADHLRKQDLDTGAQIIFYDFELIESGHRRKWAMFDRDSDSYLEKKEYFAAACRNRLNSAWSKLYLRSVLLENGIFFDETMVFAEDAKFVFQAVTAANGGYYASRILYRYHHDFKSGDRRLARFPETVTRNSIMLYELRMASLDRPEIQALFTQEELAALHTAVRERVVRDLFETAGSLRIMGRFDDSINQLIQPLAARLREEYINDFSAGTRLKCLLLSKDRGFAVKLLAYLREIYIRVRR